MQRLTEIVRQHLLDNADIEVEEVYQIYEEENSLTVAEIRVYEDNESKEAIAEISKYKTKVTTRKDANKVFKDYVKAYWG